MTVTNDRKEVKSGLLLANIAYGFERKFCTLLPWSGVRDLRSRGEFDEDIVHFFWRRMYAMPLLGAGFQINIRVVAI